MTIDVQIAAILDDAGEDASGNVYATLTPLINCDGTGEWNAWRFTGITIPAGATITAAYLSVWFTNSNLDEPDVTIYGLDTASPEQFATGTGTFTISSRSRTTASVDWADSNAGSGAFVNTADISTIVQELVDSYAPYSSGVMGFCWTSRANDGARDTSAQSYDGSSSNCAKLHIEYTAAGGGSPMALYAQQ